MVQITNTILATTFTSNAIVFIVGTDIFQSFLIGVERNLITGTEQPEIIFGTPGDDEIRALGGDDIIIGTTGNDLIDGGDGFDTVDYRELDRAITILTAGAIDPNGDVGGQLDKIERIIGAVGQPNTIDGSGGIPGVSFDFNLLENRATVNNIPGAGSVTFTVENFVNVVGTPSGDLIVGNDANNILIGGSGDDVLIGNLGNDALSGGDGNDLLQGTTNTSIARLIEIDVLTGGNGTDRFIIGDISGSFYKNQGDNDFALITDFSFGEQIQLGTNDVYNIQQNDTGFDLFVVTSGVRDLIARVLQVTEIDAEINLAQLNGTLLESLPQGNFQLTSGQSNSIFFVA